MLGTGVCMVGSSVNGAKRLLNVRLLSSAVRPWSWCAVGSQQSLAVTYTLRSENPVPHVSSALQPAAFGIPFLTDFLG